MWPRCDTRKCFLFFFFAFRALGRRGRGAVPRGAAGWPYQLRWCSGGSQAAVPSEPRASEDGGHPQGLGLAVANYLRRSGRLHVHTITNCLCTSEARYSYSNTPLLGVSEGPVLAPLRYSYSNHPPPCCYFHSCSSFFPVLLFHPLCYLFFPPFSGRRYKMTHKGWHVDKPQHNQIRLWIQIHILNNKRWRSQLIWIYTVCKGMKFTSSTGLVLKYPNIYFNSDRVVCVENVSVHLKCMRGNM